MIEGVLRHCTTAEIDRDYVDTHGQSVVGFAFSHLLGFRLLPRLKNIATQRLYRVGQSTDRERLAPILTRPIHWELIAQQYDQLVKYATAPSRDRGSRASAAPLHPRRTQAPDLRDYRTHLQAVLKRKPAPVNNALSAIDDLYIRRGIGPASATRADLSKSAPRTLSKRAAVRFLRGVEARLSSRDQALALIPFYAGTRIAEVVGLDVDDVQLSARKGILRIYGKGEKVREIPIHAQLRTALAGWLDERPGWPGADDPALFLNQQGGRLSVKGAHDIVTGIATTAGLDDDTTTHVLRHTFATRLVRGGTDLVVVAELLGHARLETTRGYTRPTCEDAVKALELLDVDH